MTAMAERAEGAGPEQLLVAPVGLEVVHIGGLRHSAFGQAVRAQRMRPELGEAQGYPSGREVELAPGAGVPTCALAGLAAVGAATLVHKVAASAGIP